MSVEVLDGIARLCTQHRLPAASDRRLLALLEVLERDPLAPTTVRDGRAALDVHLADSLVALRLDEVRTAKRVVDIGAGAGFPGLPLAIALPHAQIALLESISRKCTFLEVARRAAEVSNARVVRDRAETWTDGLRIHDLVTARALAAPATVLEYAAPLLSLGGSLVDWRGSPDEIADRSAAAAAGELGMELVAVHKVQPFSAAREHRLCVYRKVAETPAAFPRRPGVARKRPLGG
ncbi:MAG TPA: 16S rRNA (guanine(527)-N(7))-methyltransferase RsmG [Solirubrobacteraceae bacterium]|jgi:16S rRNA (guanine527-N7)-methyltransferase